MRRLAILVAVLATVHVAETVVTQERVVRVAAVTGRVASLVRTVWTGWRKEIWGWPVRRLGAG